MIDLSGKKALVTGGGSGIGRGICIELSRANAEVYVLDLEAEAASETVSSLEDSGGKAHPIVCDISSAESVSNALRGLHVDILVNNAGVAHVGTIEDTTEEDLDLVYRVNVKGLYNVTRELIPSMAEARSGAIVNMASIASSVGIRDRFAYSMSKGAVLTMTYSIAKDYIEKGIRCNSVSPARVYTPFVEGFLQKNYPDKRDEMFEKLSKSQPIGRMATPSDIAPLVTFLCSDQASFITGTDFPADGGFIKLSTHSG